MGKNKATRLHELIQALSPAEKKYFHLNIGKFHPKEGNKQLLLFQTINKHKNYNKEAIETAYTKARYTPKHLPTDHNKLYNSVLDSIRDFNVDNAAESKLYDSIQKITILFEKKLFDHALKLIDRSKKTAYQYEIYGALINLISLEQRILKVLGKIDEALALIDEQQAVWKQQELFNQMIKLHYQSIKLRISLSKARDEGRLNQLEELLQNPVLKKANPSSFWIEFHRLETYCNYHFIKDEQEQELFYNQQLIKLYQQYHWFQQDQPLNYLVIHTRFLAIKRHLHPQQFEKALQEYRQLGNNLKKQKREAQSTIFIFSYNYELDNYLKQRAWKKALNLIPTMEKGLKKHYNLIRDALIVGSYHRFAHAFFFNQDYSNALKYILKIQNDFSPTVRPDVYYFAFLFQIITHYELGHYKLLPYLIKTAKYHLDKHKSLHKVEALTMLYLKKLSKELPTTKSIQLFQNFEQELSMLLKDEYESRILQIFDLLAWIQSKTGSNSPK
ncbi:MAG: hypothetical protein GY810_31995 [Aureispira sp.]|nr:hypothetical protein [Aureispira sp.]